MAEYPFITEPVDPEPPAAASPATVDLRHGDCLAVLRTLPDESVHCVITDPPYGLSDHPSAEVITALTAWANGDRERVPSGRGGFMGRNWDSFVPPPAVWDECFRVLKPGGHLACFAGSRTHDLMGLSIRMAGFEIRDGLQWIYGSGFPKGINVSKAIDKAAGVQREVVGTRMNGIGKGRGAVSYFTYSDNRDITAPATDAAREWDGWSTSLKPAVEPITLARKPFKGTVAANIVQHGTGAMNIDGCRVGDEQRVNAAAGNKPGGSSLNMSVVGMPQGVEGREATGRFPANVLFSHSEECADVCDGGCPVAELDAQSGVLTSGATKIAHADNVGARSGGIMSSVQGSRVRSKDWKSDSGGASRFFPSFRYQAKAPKTERPTVDGKGHPTVKPVALMRWLVRLVTPPGGTVLDPFAGSGTTGQAARDAGFAAILVETDEHSVRLCEQRLGLPRTAAAPDPEPVDLWATAAPSSWPPEPACEVHGEHGGTADCPECQAELNDAVGAVLGVVYNDALPLAGDDRIRLEENALAAETVADAHVVRDELRAILVAARNRSAPHP